MAGENGTNPYIGAGIIGGFILLIVIGVLLKERKKRKLQKTSDNGIPQEVQLPDDMNMEDLENVEFFKTPEKATLKEATTDAIRLLQAKRNVIKADIIRNRKKMIEELKRVKQTQVEIYGMTKLLVGYYKDLKIKEKILKVSVSGLIEDEQK